MNLKIDIRFVIYDPKLVYKQSSWNFLKKLFVAAQTPKWIHIPYVINSVTAFFFLSMSFVRKRYSITIEVRSTVRSLHSIDHNHQIVMINHYSTLSQLLNNTQSFESSHDTLINQIEESMNLMLQFVLCTSIWFSNSILLQVIMFYLFPLICFTFFQCKLKKKDSEGITDMVGNDVKHIKDAIGMDVWK